MAMYDFIYGLFEAFVLRNDTAQLGERVPQSLSNDVIKLLRVRVPVIANFYDPTTFVLIISRLSKNAWYPKKYT